MQTLFKFFKRKSYHNTNKETGNTLIKSNTKASRQEMIILNYFKANAHSKFSPEDVINQVDFGKPVPITSVRRAITNLCKEGHLNKTSVMKKGNYGKQVHTWEINLDKETIV